MNKRMIIRYSGYYEKLIGYFFDKLRKIQPNQFFFKLDYYFSMDFDLVFNAYTHQNFVYTTHSPNATNVFEVLDHYKYIRNINVVFMMKYRDKPNFTNTARQQEYSKTQLFDIDYENIKLHLIGV